MCIIFSSGIEGIHCENGDITVSAGTWAYTFQDKMTGTKRLMTLPCPTSLCQVSKVFGVYVKIVVHELKIQIHPTIFRFVFFFDV